MRSEVTRQTCSPSPRPAEGRVVSTHERLAQRDGDAAQALLLRADPGTVEEARWRKASNPDGVPAFSHDGLVCTAETYQDKVELTFAMGASPPDPTGLSNASLVAWTRRAIDLFEGDSVDEEALVALVRDVAACNRS